MLLSCESCEGTDSMFSLLILLEIINETAGKGQLMVIIKKVMRYYHSLQLLEKTLEQNKFELFQ